MYVHVPLPLITAELMGNFCLSSLKVGGKFQTIATSVNM